MQGTGNGCTACHASAENSSGVLMRGQSAAALSAAESAAAIHLNTILLAEGIDCFKTGDGDRADPFAGIHVHLAPHPFQ